MRYSYWRISHNADTTETGLFQGVQYIRARWQGHSAHERQVLILRDYCASRFGGPTAYVQGVAPVAAWAINECSKEDWDKAEGVLWGGRRLASRRITMALGTKEGTKEQWSILSNEDGKKPPVKTDAERLENLEVELGRAAAAKSVYLQRINALVRKMPHLKDWAEQTIELADKKALAVKPEDLVVAEVTKKEA